MGNLSQLGWRCGQPFFTPPGRHFEGQELCICLCIPLACGCPTHQLLHVTLMSTAVLLCDLKYPKTDKMKWGVGISCPVLETCLCFLRQGCLKGSIRVMRLSPALQPTKFKPEAFEKKSVKLFCFGWTLLTKIAKIVLQVIWFHFVVAVVSFLHVDFPPFSLIGSSCLLLYTLFLPFLPLHTPGTERNSQFLCTVNGLTGLQFVTVNSFRFMGFKN